MVILLATAVVVWALSKPPDVYSGVATVVGTLVALVTAAVMLTKRRNVPEPSTDEELDKAAAALSGALWRQWPPEAERRGLVCGQPADVRWKSRGPTAVGVLGRPQTAPDGGDPYEQRVVRNFTTAATRRVLVIGPPGSGKTVHLLLLTLGLLRRREEKGGNTDEPVPVLLPTAHWNPLTEPFGDWATARLKEGYHFLENTTYGTSAPRGLLESRRVVLVLDGLDEMRGDLQEEALRQLTQPPVQSWPVVVACTSAVFASLRGKDHLNFSGMRITTLRALSTSRALAFLSSADDSRHGPQRWEPVRNAITGAGNVDLAAALCTPLFAGLARSVYGVRGRSPQMLLDAAQAGDVRLHLLESFLHDAFALSGSLRNRPSVPRDGAASHWNPHSARRWLQWLAGYLEGDQSRYLFWWHWHSMLRPREWAGVCGLLAATVYLLTSGFPEGLARGTPVGMALGLIVGICRDRADGARQGLRVGVACTVVIGAAGLVLHGAVGAVHDAVELGLPLGAGISMISWMQASTVRIVMGSAASGLAAGCWAGAWDALADGPSAGLHRWLTTSLGMTIAVAFTNFLVRMTGSSQAPGQPTGLNTALRDRWRDLVVHLGVGAAAGTAIGVGGGSIIILRAALAHRGHAGVPHAVAVAVTYGITAVLAIGITGAVIRWLSQPSAQVRAATMKSTLTAARVMSAAYVVLATGLGAAVMAAVHSAAGRVPDSMRADILAMADYRQGAALGLCIGLVLAASFTPWPTFVIVRVVSWASRRLPLRLTGFLDDAHRAEVLRAEGASYTFRHDEIRQCLLTGP
ncbi:hypothetical protein ACGFY9_47995 [Streptomyces sp. NPDC048504]|uniref:hypothetical protein n=1 Tax=Streptomyces sp. NPDC048504 TaxID=3365559 RepID=UPI00371E5D47